MSRPKPRPEVSPESNAIEIELAQLRSQVRVLADLLIECGILDASMLNGRLQSAASRIAWQAEGAVVTAPPKRGFWARLFRRRAPEPPPRPARPSLPGSVPTMRLADQTVPTVMPFSKSVLYGEADLQTDRRERHLTPTDVGKCEALLAHATARVEPPLLPLRLEVTARLALCLALAACAAREPSMNKRPIHPGVFVRGPSLSPASELSSWLARQERLVRLPIVLRAAAVGFSLRGARIGAAPDALEIELGDAALGIGLSDRAQQRCRAKERCALWLDGFWKEGFFDVRRVHAPIALDAVPDWAEVESD